MVQNKPSFWEKLGLSHDFALIFDMSQVLYVNHKRQKLPGFFEVSPRSGKFTQRINRSWSRHGFSDFCIAYGAIPDLYIVNNTFIVSLQMFTNPYTLLAVDVLSLVINLVNERAIKVETHFLCCLVADANEMVPLPII